MIHCILIHHILIKKYQVLTTETWLVLELTVQTNLTLNSENSAASVFVVMKLKALKSFSTETIFKGGALMETGQYWIKIDLYRKDTRESQ